ncbi:DUF7305 domain-containing protein [Ureibacillus sp. MALMAid1270]|uniref:DUF7305 domain-containing protein n=1 Tax=Ureibacillus sp. MALMAid1270 TaxID=3411629 RepID=UPI003BA82925
MIKYKFKSILFNQEGYSLLLTIFAISLFTILGMSIFAISGNTMNTSKSERDDQTTYYVAEAALVETIPSIEKLVDTAFNETKEWYDKKDEKTKSTIDFEKAYKLKVKDLLISEQNKALTNDPYTIFKLTYNNFTTNQGFQPKATISMNVIEEEGIPSQIELLSIGKIGTSERKIKQLVNLEFNVKSDTITKVVPINSSNPANLVKEEIKNELDFLNPNNSDKPILFYTHPNENNTTNGMNKNVEFSISTYNPSKINFQADMLKDKFKGFQDGTYSKLKKLLINNSNNIQLTESAYYVDNPFSISDKTSLTLNITKPLTNLYIKENLHYNGGNKSELIIKGSGEVNLFINGDFSINRFLDLKSDPSVKVNIFIKNNFNLNNDFKLKANIYALNTSNINIQKKTYQINGSLFTLSELIQIDHPNLTINGICAPNAVYQSNGTYTLKTSYIVVKRLNIKGVPSLVHTINNNKYNACAFPDLSEPETNTEMISYTEYYDAYELTSTKSYYEVQ